MDGEVIAYISRFSFFSIENESRGGSEGAMNFEFFFFFLFRVTSKCSYQLKVSICKPMARNLHRTSTGIIYEKSLEIH